MTAADRLAALLGELGSDLDPAAARLRGVDPVLPSRYPLGESAAAVLAAVGLAVARLGERAGGPAQEVAVGVRHAGVLLRGFLDQVVDGEVLDDDPTGELDLVGLFRGSDGAWLQTYGAFSPLRERTMEVLACREDRATAARAIARRPAHEVVEALNAAGAPAALVRSAAAWEEHPQGRALRATPLVEVLRIGDAPPRPAGSPGARPLHGTRVLDLTRIIAGPTCARTLAEHGADVLALHAPGLPTVHRALVDTSAGKRSAAVDLRTPEGAAALDALLPRADVVCESARPGTFARRGLGAEDLARRVPGIVVASVGCYGHSGPWAGRAGFEPLAQATTGWAEEHGSDGVPAIVPALPCDHLTGHLAALGVLIALERRAEEGGSWHVRTSLTRTAMWLRDQPGRHDPAGAPPVRVATTADLRVRLQSAYGVLEPVRPAPQLSRTPPRWDGPPSPPGTHPPSFAT